MRRFFLRSVSSSSAAVVVAGREEHLDELLDELLGEREVDRAVDDDDPAERAHRVGGEGALVGVEPRPPDGRAARVVVLDDHARRDLELARDPPRAVEVEQVVERELLAVVLLDHRQHVHPRADLRVVRGALVRVLAVREVDDLLVGADVEVREVLGPLGEPAGDARVVARGVGERLGGERLARLRGERALAHPHLLEHGVVALGRHDDRGVRVVLRRGADHRRAADVDVLDHLGVGDPAPRRRALERIEVHAHEVDRLDVVLLERLRVLGVLADGEQAGVELRVQRLDAAVHDLGEAGVVRDRADRDAGLLERGRGAAGRDELDPQLLEALGEVHDPALVADGQQRAAHLHRRAGRRREGLCVRHEPGRYAVRVSVGGSGGTRRA